MPSSNSKKLVNAAHEGDVAADEDIETPDDVKMCCVCGRVDKVLRCSKCHATHYCSKECQREHFPYHSVYCYTIVDLQKLEVETHLKSSQKSYTTNRGWFPIPLGPKDAQDHPV